MKNQRGFSIIQVIISLGILSGLFVVGLKLFQNQTRLGKSSSFKFEALVVMDEMKSILSNPESCMVTLGGKSAFYDDVLEVLRFNPLSEKGETEFAIKKEKTKPYGQNNLFIESMILYGDNQKFSAEAGYSLFKIKFIEEGNLGDEMEVEFPIKVVINELGRVVSCFSQPGIHQGKTSQSGREFWKNKKGKKGKSVGIFYRQGPLKVGNVEIRGGFNVESGLSMFSHEKKCLKDMKGVLAFGQYKQHLKWCDGNEWTVLNNSKPLIKERSGFKIQASRGATEIKTTKKVFKFCRIKEYKLNKGQCWARPTSNVTEDSTYELVAQHYEGEKVSCVFTCMR